MSSQSEYAGTVSTGNFASSGTNWTNPTNAEGSPSGNFATVTLTHSTSSYSIDAYNFGFSVSGTINGLVGGCTAKATAALMEFLATYVEIDSTAGAFTANLLAGTTQTTTATTYSVGSSTDTCGFNSTELSAANVNGNGENTGPTFGLTIHNSEVSVSLTGSIEGLELTCYYTASSPPGAPSGIAASNAGPTSIGLTWAQGSGTVTDNPIQYQVAGAGSWTNVDPGSAVTSYTLTGLTHGTLYFLQVAAENTNGTSSYDGPIPWVCGSTWTGQVAQSTDDATEFTSTGGMSLTDTSDALGNNTIAGFRFESVAISQAADVNAAYLYLYATGGSNTGVYPFDCQLATNAGTFTSSTNNLSGRSLTGNSATMNVASWGSGWNQGPNIAGAAAAVFDQSGWSSGNALVVVVGQGGNPSLTVEMWDGNPVEAAILAIFTADVSDAITAAAIAATMAAAECAATCAAAQMPWMM